MLPVLAKQDFQGKYRAARLGIAWTAIQPLVRGIVLAIVFTLIVRIETDVPYPPFVLAGTATWAFLSESVRGGTTSIVHTGALAGKVYFPRLLLPGMPAASLLPSYAITLVVVIVVSSAYGQFPSLRLLALPVAVILGIALVYALCCVTSLLHVYFRDVGHLISTGLLVLFYLTPVIYEQDAGGRFAWLLSVNPFTGPIALVRWSLFDGSEALMVPLLFSVGWTALLLAVGIKAFQRHDRISVDRL